MKNILFFSGSNNPKSVNQIVILTVSEMFVKTSNTIINLREYPMPIYSIETEEKEGIPENAIKLKAIIDITDSLVISVPENNGSVTAFFKNTMDWLSRVDKNYKIFKNKSVLLFCTSPVGGCKNSIVHAEEILKRLGASIIGKIVISNFFEQLTELNGKFQFKDEHIKNEIFQLAVSLSE